MRLRGTLSFKEGRLYIIKPKSNARSNIDKYTSKFIIFISIMFGKFPTKAEELLKYLRGIGNAATWSNKWSKYDEQFCLRMTSQPHAS